MLRRGAVRPGLALYQALPDDPLSQLPLAVRRPQPESPLSVDTPTATRIALPAPCAVPPITA